jgi:L-ascorbate metabolism protein UlaG (beta-lactamase superfamily)
VTIETEPSPAPVEGIVPKGPSGQIVWLGHSTVLIELDGVRLLTDPVLRSRVMHLRRAAPASDPGSVDAVLVSHGHNDHLDLPSLKRLPRETPVIAPRGLGRLLRRFPNTTEVDEGDEVPVGPVTVRATHADHAGRPSPGRSRAAVGYAVLGSRSVYFAGDTDVFPAMDGLIADLDLALLPVWGWGPALGPGHMNPERAAEALVLLRPKSAVPVHWGTLRPLHRSSRAAFLHDPPHEFAAAAQRLAPEVAVHIVPLGGGLELG